MSFLITIEEVADGTDLIAVLLNDAPAKPYLAPPRKLVEPVEVLPALTRDPSLTRDRLVDAKHTLAESRKTKPTLAESRKSQKSREELKRGLFFAKTGKQPYGPGTMPEYRELPVAGVEALLEKPESADDLTILMSRIHWSGLDGRQLALDAPAVTKPESTPEVTKAAEVDDETTDADRRSALAAILNITNIDALEREED